LREYITFYWSAVSSETGKGLALSVCSSRHNELLTIKTFRLVHKGHQQIFFTSVICLNNRNFNTDRLVLEVFLSDFLSTQDFFD